MNDVPAKHIPVLADTLLQQISLPKDAVMVDATIGQGGHAYLLAKKFEPVSHIIGFDVDPGSIEVAKENLEVLDCKVTLIRDNFSNIRSRMNEIGVAESGFSSGRSWMVFGSGSRSPTRYELPGKYAAGYEAR